MSDTTRTQAARTIQRAARRYLKKKYVYNTSDRMVLNTITSQAIPKNRAIVIPGPDDVAKVWDSAGLYNWFIKKNNTELPGFISSLAPIDRERIVKLNKLSVMLKKQRNALKKKTIKGTSFLNNVTEYAVRRVDKAMEIITYLLLLYIAVLAMQWMGRVLLTMWSPGTALRQLGAIFGMASASFIGDGLTRSTYERKLKSLEQRLEKEIDNITSSNIELVKYLEHRNSKFIQRHMVPNNMMVEWRKRLVTISDRLRARGLM
jgi:hypothetical protein